MPLCFEVTINDELTVVAGSTSLRVLTAILSFVPERSELAFDVSGMVEDTQQVEWLKRDLESGDVLTIRIRESENVSEPIVRHRADPAIEAEAERKYYERLRRKYEPNRS